MSDTARIETLERCVSALGDAVVTLVWWLHDAQSGFGRQDARGIEDRVREALKPIVQPGGGTEQ